MSCDDADAVADPVGDMVTDPVADLIGDVAGPGQLPPVEIRLAPNDL